jgi:hypothetical protein
VNVETTPATTPDDNMLREFDLTNRQNSCGM